MELSLLCDVNIYLYMHDTSNNRVVHFQSNAEADLRNVFKTRSSREFYSNADVSIQLRVSNMGYI